MYSGGSRKRWEVRASRTQSGGRWLGEGVGKLGHKRCVQLGLGCMRGVEVRARGAQASVWGMHGQACRGCDSEGQGSKSSVGTMPARWGQGCTGR